MSRPLRILYPDAFYHVMSRGRGRQDMFHGSAWFKAFLKGLEEAHERFGAQIHGYCLMTNHYHLMIKTPEANLDRIMRHVNGVYTQRHNRLSNTDGSLIRGRYKANVVQHDSYWLRLSRYVHRNPIETKVPLVRRLQSYRWSSYRVYLGLECKPPWLFVSDTFDLLGHSCSTSYRNYVENDNDRDFHVMVDQSVLGVPVLGCEKFVEQLKKYQEVPAAETARREWGVARGDVNEIIRFVSCHYGVEPAYLTNSSRGRKKRNTPRLVAMYLCQTAGGLSLASIAAWFGYRSYSGVATALQRLHEQMKRDSRLKQEVERLLTIVNRG